MTNENTKGNSAEIGRRGFVASVGAGLAVSAVSVSGAGLEVVETNVDIKTADGTCDAAFIHPKSGAHAGVIIWPDAFGLRPAMREMGKRLAAEGYSVLVPNPYYRVAKDPFTDASTFSFSNPADRQKLQPLMGSITKDGAVETDAPAFVEFLDSQKQVNKSKKIGTQGYCMGGPLVFRTCACVPDRLGAGATFHGGGLVTKNPNSPHLLIPKMHSQMLIAIAASDDKGQPDAKDKLKESFDEAHLKAEIEVYTGTYHGWCVPDMPKQANGDATYSKPDAERAWSRLLVLYKSALA